jgi:phosphatidylethanolamine/phosphatidyl-N-methylethanolamine N-methyltransferase
MEEAKTSGLYDLWAKFYDATFGRLVRRRQVRAVEVLRARPGERVLDLGIGTGMTLPHYPKGVQVVGMDLSPGMLGKARAKAATSGAERIDLILGDAMHPPFAAGSFDHVLITHVISVVSEPPKLLAWARRLVKPGGRIVILNHFQSANPLIRFFERWLNPLFVKIGWRSDLDLAELLRACPMGVEYQFKLSRFDLWQIIVLSDGPHSPPPPEPDEALQPTIETGSFDDARVSDRA